VAWFLPRPNVPKIAPLALPSALLPTCPPTRRDGPTTFMAIISWTPMTYDEHFLNLGLGVYVSYCSHVQQQYLNVLNANANCPSLLPDPSQKCGQNYRTGTWQVAMVQVTVPSAVSFTPHVVGHLSVVIFLSLTLHANQGCQSENSCRKP